MNQVSSSRSSPNSLNKKPLRSYDSLMNEIGSERNPGSRVTSRGTASRLNSRATNRSVSPGKYSQKPLTPLKIALRPKDPNSKSAKVLKPSGIKSTSNTPKRDPKILVKDNISLKLPKKENGLQRVLPPLKQDNKGSLKKRSKKGDNGVKGTEGLAIKDTIYVTDINSRKNSIITHINRRKSSVGSSLARDALRLATMNNKLDMDEDALNMNDEGVSFSLSSRIKRRQTIVINEEHSISQEAAVAVNENDNHKRKFRKSITKVLNGISIVQDPVDEVVPMQIEPPKSKNVSIEELSKTENIAIQTTYSAHVVEEQIPKKVTKTVAATIGVVKKPSSKPESKNIFKPAPPGAYMGIKIHPRLMLPPFPFPTKNEILFGPYENSLFEVQDSLCIKHLFQNLDYYYMPTDPIRESLLEPSRFLYAVEPVYNDKHIATEVLNMLPIRRSS